MGSAPVNCEEKRRRARAFDFEPKGGWGPLWLNQTQPEGEIDQLGDLTVRRYGPASNPNWVLWGHDIFGPLSGRTMEYCAKIWNLSRRMRPRFTPRSQLHRHSWTLPTLR